MVVVVVVVVVRPGLPPHSFRRCRHHTAPPTHADENGEHFAH